MKKTYLFFLVFIPFVLSASMPYGLVITQKSSELCEILPGNLVSKSFLISNKTGTSQELQGHLELPDGWMSVPSKLNPLTLDPKSSAPQFFTLRPPVNTLAGDYKISFVVRSLSNCTVFQREEFTVTILPLRNISTVIESMPKFLPAGDSFIMRAKVANLGNTISTVAISAIDQYKHLKAINTPDLIALRPNETREIELKFSSSKQITRVSKALLRIVANVQEDQKVSTLTTESIEVIPSKSAQSQSKILLPASVTIGGAVNKGKATSFATFEGKGFLDDGIHQPSAVIKPLCLPR